MSGRARLAAGIAATMLGASAPAAAPSSAAADTPSAARFGVELQEAWIPMADGVRLAADIWRPTGSGAGGRFPVLLEYLPYRKTESRGDRYPLYAYFVRRGYVVARVDIRGTGNSEGTLVPHEYSDVENQDGEQLIGWLARQPFASGKVGMFGISWGGFNSIHLAMRRPAALAAIVATCATDDLYQDDVHFIDGMMHVDSWELSQDLANAMPGAPDYTIDERYFAERFDQPPWMLSYKRQQRDGPFWDRTALKARYEALRVPALLVGGWYDGYRDSIPRMLENVRAPLRAIVGPWNHTWPHEPYPKPGFEFRHEAVRFFDRWLKGRDTGITEEPSLAVYVRGWHPPGPHLDEAPGRWRFEDGWPLARAGELTLHPGPGRALAEVPPPAGAEHLRYVPTSGVEAGGPVMWWGDVAPDQRPTDAFSLVYETEPLDTELEILGLPLAHLRVSADAIQADWFARLSDVAPDGSVTLVTGAGQNGAHRRSAREPEPIEPGQPFDLPVEMHFTSWVFPRGHRLRLSVANAQWPMIWPTPYAMTTTLHLGPGATRLVLPVVPPADRPRPAWREIEADADRLAGYEAIDPGTTSGYGEIASVEREPGSGRARVVATSTSGTRYPWGEETTSERLVHEAEDGRPEAASLQAEHSTTVRLADRTLRFESRVRFSSDRASFYYDGTRRLLQDGRLVREKHWQQAIPRDHQ